MFSFQKSVRNHTSDFDLHTCLSHTSKGSHCTCTYKISLFEKETSKELILNPKGAVSFGEEYITGYKIKDDRKFLGTFIMSFNALVTHLFRYYIINAQYGRKKGTSSI